MTSLSNITCKELSDSDWPALEELFGSKGACGGCWCMHWRVPHGGKVWEAAKGEPNRQAMKELVSAGKVRGVLAFDGSRPAAWCSFGRRIEFPRLETVKAYRRDDIERVWCLNCFFIPAPYRGIGLVYRLAETAIKGIKRRRGRIVEAYPVTLTRDGNKLPPAFSYTGPESVFVRLGFTEVQRMSASRPLYRLEL